MESENNIKITKSEIIGVSYDIDYNGVYYNCEIWAGRGWMVEDKRGKEVTGTLYNLICKAVEKAIEETAIIKCIS